ncbi:MAG: uncharacterized protein JWM10_218 [Myxococcaceae bacterium]|nr:uncharacterized protein [Myxococcaceae bacterium]
MTRVIGHEAAIPNPALKPLGFLVGEWHTEGSHPLLPGKILRGRTSFAWSDGGAFLVMRSEINEAEVPSGIAILGTDVDAGECSMMYFDERGVSRRYLVALRSDRWHWWRDAPGFSQRFTAELVDGGRRMAGRGELNRGDRWEPDLQLTYTRVG